MITESDDLSQSLDRAAQLWPELASERSALLKRILDLGIEDVRRHSIANQTKKKQAILRVAGSLSEVWPEGWRSELSNEWPD